MKFLLVGILTLSSATAASGLEKCKTGLGFSTPYGKLVSVRCSSDGVDKSHTLLLNDVKLVEDVRLFDEAGDKARRLHVYKSGDFSSETACSKKLYLLDLSVSPSKVLAFGVKNACNEFHWASWGDKRSVIALKHNVKFVYESGKLIPPAKGEALWNAIEPPHSGPGLSIEDAIPFVEDVPLPHSWIASQPR